MIFKENIDFRGKKGVTPLMIAADWNQIEVLDFLIRKNANVHLIDRNGKTAADYAIIRAEKDGDYRALLKLVGAGATPRKEKLVASVALIEAANLNDVERVRRIVSIGIADLKFIPPNDQPSAFAYAIKNRNAEIALLLTYAGDASDAPQLQGLNRKDVHWYFDLLKSKSISIIDDYVDGVGPDVSKLISDFVIGPNVNTYMNSGPNSSW